MATLCDSYSESNQSGTGSLDTNDYTGQSFTGNGGVLQSVKFYIKKDGSQTGTVRANIFAHSGTFGSSSVPTGSALATSASINADDLQTSLSLTTFTFTGANKITLTNGTKYVVVFETINVNSSFPNYVTIGWDASSPTHDGNYAYYQSSTWYAGTFDLCFYVYTDASSASASPSISISSSPSLSPSSSTSPSEGSSPSASQSPSASVSLSPSISVSLSQSVSISLSSSLSQSATQSASPSPSPMPEAFFGLKISKPGVNALTNSDIDKYIFHSDYGTLKYHLEGVISVSGSADPGDTTTVTETVTHDLGYFPFHVAYVSLNESTYYPQSYAELGSGASVYITTWVTTTTLVLQLTIDNTAGGSPLSNTAYCQYKIFINDLSL